MMTKVYELETKFNFGKNKGKTVEEVFSSGGKSYIGYLIISSNKRFVIHPNFFDYLSKLNFFEDMPFQCDGLGNELSTDNLGNFDTKKMLQNIKEQYQEYINNPLEYNKKVHEEAKEYYRNKEQEAPTNSNEGNRVKVYGSSNEKYGGHNGYNDDDIDEVFDGDPTATWNID
jgi:hypothetical protein